MHIKLENSSIELKTEYFDKTDADRYFKYLLDSKNINWKQESMNVYGKNVDYPRLIAWYGEPGKDYRFSGKTQNPNDWSKCHIIMEIKDHLEAEVGETFNSVLLNMYRDGNDSISWHSDNEKELGENPTIMSVSFGAERLFKMRRYDGKSFVCPFTNKNKKSTNIPLANNSLLIMKNETQRYWQHSIDKKKDNPDLGLFSSIHKQRINLTFRRIVNI